MARSPTPKTEDGTEATVVQPVLALVKIVYGAQKVAEPQTIFSPVSEAERDELLLGEFVRELDGGEAALAEKLAAPAPVDLADPENPLG